MNVLLAHQMRRMLMLRQHSLDRIHALLQVVLRRTEG
jgi:hypothetical protein